MESIAELEKAKKDLFDEVEKTLRKNRATNWLITMMERFLDWLDKKMSPKPKINIVLPLTKCNIPMPRVSPPREPTEEERARAGKIAYDEAVKRIKQGKKEAEKYGGFAGIDEMGFYVYTGDKG